MNELTSCLPLYILTHKYYIIYLITKGKRINSPFISLTFFNIHNKHRSSFGKNHVVSILLLDKETHIVCYQNVQCIYHWTIYLVFHMDHTSLPLQYLQFVKETNYFIKQMKIYNILILYYLILPNKIIELEVINIRFILNSINYKSLNWYHINIKL